MADNTDLLSFTDQQTFFARVDESVFWTDRERVTTLILLYEHYECLWNVRSPDYKNVSKKKVAKVDIGKHFGWSGTN